MARYDLLLAVSYLSATVTEWTVSCDQDLRRLVAYINAALSLWQVSWSGGPASSQTLTLRVAFELPA
eukprot:4429211-Prorocentrum_lima.AAC.1